MSSGTDRVRRGLVELKYTFFMVWINRGTQVHLGRCISDVWYWWWLVFFLDFAGILYFWMFTGYKLKEGEHIHDRLHVLPIVSLCE